MIENNLPVSVLIVDDNPAMLAALVAALEGMGIGIVTADSGEEALRKLMAQDFAVVLLDVNMPVMDGFETATMLRSLPKSEHLPILFITAERLSDDARLQGYQYGAVDYILSPILPQILRSKVAVFADLYRLREQIARVLADARVAAESEKKFRIIFEGANDGIVLTDAQSGLVEDCNPEFERQCGRPLSQLKTLHIWELRPPELQEAAHRKFEEVKATGHSSDDLGFQRPDGTFMPAEISATRARIDGRNFIISISRDITERKQAERILKLQSDTYTRILNAISDGVYVVNRNYDIEYLNPVLVSAFGEAAGRKCFTYFHDRTEPCPWCKNAEVFKGNMVRWEWHSDKTGKTYDLLDSPIINADGSVSKIEIFHDITERKREEEKIRQLNQDYDRLTDNADEAIFRVEAKGGHIIYCNPAAERIFGYSLEEWQADPELGFKLIHPDYREKQQQIIEQIRKNKLPVKNVEFGWIAKGGKTVLMEYTITPLIDAEGEVVIFESIGRDISERKRTEQKLQNSLAAQEVLMREIHHRVKNNLQMMSSLLELQSGYVKDEQVQGFFKDCQQRIQSMAMIHEQLYHNKNLAKIDFAAYLHSLMDNLRGQYGERCSRVNIQINASACTLPVDIAIPCGLVISELVSNAFKHAFPEGRSGELRIGLQCGGEGKVILEVADDGVGLPAGLDVHHSKSFGMQLVALMVEEQLHGKLSVESNGQSAAHPLSPSSLPQAGERESVSLRENLFNRGTRVVCEIGGAK